jgi:hypothetical protein
LVAGILGSLGSRSVPGNRSVLGSLGNRSVLGSLGISSLTNSYIVNNTCISSIWIYLK